MHRVKDQRIDKKRQLTGRRIRYLSKGVACNTDQFENEQEKAWYEFDQEYSSSMRVVHVDFAVQRADAP